MDLRRMAILAAAALIPFQVQPAGTTGLSSYLQQIPAPPRTAQEAYRACEVDDAIVAGTGTRPDGGRLVEIQSPRALTLVRKKIEGEGTLAATQGVAGAPPVPGMGMPTDAASAQAMVEAMQKMSPAQQQAMAQQMAAQSGPMSSGAMSPADSQMAGLLGQRQQGSMSRMQQDLKAQQDWALVLQRWDAEHAALSNEEDLKRNSWTGSCPNGTLNPIQKIRRDYAEKHIKLMTAQINEGLAAYEKRRALAVDTAGFADRLAPLAAKAMGPLSKQGYSTARGEAVRDLGSLVAISDELHRRAAYWYMMKRAVSKDDICDGRAG